MVVSLGDYRSEGVRVFAGYGRGKVVAESIVDEYGRDVDITVPEDVIYISNNFRAGFKSVFPDFEFGERYT